MRKAKNNIGIVFCSLDDTIQYCQRFIQKRYSIDALRLVIVDDPDNNVREWVYSSENEHNRAENLSIELVPILDFWRQYFGEEECDNLISFINAYNEKAQEIFGLNTVISPTEKAIEAFKKKCGEDLVKYATEEHCPVGIDPTQLGNMQKKYIERQLWKAMVGRSDFATSFISSEWYLNMYQLTENLDLTGIVAGYLKSIEQLLFSIIRLSEGLGVTIRTKNGIELYSQDKEAIIDSTLWSLARVIEHNLKMLDVDKTGQDYLVATIDDWRNKQRNGYFHKHNLQEKGKVEEIQEKAKQLYFLILSSCTICEDQLEALITGNDSIKELISNRK